jgi:hypothetical protein
MGGFYCAPYNSIAGFALMYAHEGFDLGNGVLHIGEVRLAEIKALAKVYDAD